MKNKPNNPFLVWGYHSPKYFCDRELETQTIIAALQNGRNISLISPRRIGKTGLIQHVFSRVKNQNPEIRCFYLDIFSTENLYDFTLLLSKTILGNLDSFSQKIMRTITSFFTHIHPVFTYDSLTGMPKLSVEISSGKAEGALKFGYHFLSSSTGQYDYFKVENKVYHIGSRPIRIQSYCINNSHFSKIYTSLTQFFCKLIYEIIPKREVPKDEDSTYYSNIL